MTLYVAREASKLRRRVMGEISMELQLLAEKFKLLIAQDILRPLMLWFNHGAASEVPMSLQKGFSHVKIEKCFVVLPQIIARIHSNYKAVRELIQSLLLRIGKGHPQALMYPLLVACKSISVLRRAAAQEVVDKIRQLSGAQLVSKELIRVAILWHETLEEASRLYFGEHNIEGILAVLDPLHAQLEDGPETLKETSFLQGLLVMAWGWGGPEPSVASKAAASFHRHYPTSSSPQIAGEDTQTLHYSLLNSL